jgi:hypothetical protein
MVSTSIVASAARRVNGGKDFFYRGDNLFTAEYAENAEKSFL